MVSEIGGSIQSGGYTIMVFGGLGLLKKGIGQSPMRQGRCGLRQAGPNEAERSEDE